MKRKILLMAAIVMCLSISAYGSLAFFTASGTAHNVITTGGVEIDVQEWADEAKTEPYNKKQVGIMPGKTVTKIVEVKNTGESAAWIRVKVDKKIVFRKGVSGEPNLDMMQLIFADSDKWTLGNDGYYYYNDPVKPGETTSELLKSVTFDTAMDNDYQKASACIEILAEAVQVANNGDTVWDASGWPNVESDADWAGVAEPKPSGKPVDPKPAPAPSLPGEATDPVTPVEPTDPNAGSNE